MPDYRRNRVPGGTYFANWACKGLPDTDWGERR
jgi:hypothetical protein